MEDRAPEFLLVRRHDGVVEIRLDRADKLNAFAGSMREGLAREIRDADADPDVGCIVVSGEGRAFCAGGDVGYMERLHAEGDISDFTRILDAANGAALALRECATATVALIQGPAAGGGANLALGCDLRLGTPQATFTQSFIHLGLAPDWGGSRVLSDIVGPDRARELLLSGRTVRSDEALALGLLHRLVPDDDALRVEGARLARSLTERSLESVAAIKQLVRSAAGGTSFADQLELEKEHQLRCFSSPFAKRAFAAFIASRKKRSPTE